MSIANQFSQKFSRPRFMLAKAVAMFMIFMLTVYAFGMWLNMSALGIVRRQTIEYTHRQLSYLAESLDREMENIFRQKVALSNDFSLGLLLLYQDNSNMGSIFTHLRRVTTHISAIYMATPHISCVGVYFPDMNRMTRWGLLFAEPADADRALISAVQVSGKRIIPYMGDLVIGISLSGSIGLIPEPDAPVGYVRLSGSSIEHTINQMALAYNLTVALYNGENHVISAGNHSGITWPHDHILRLITNEPQVMHYEGESMWVLRAPFPEWDFELVALLPHTQVDETILPIMIATVILFVLSLIIGVICFLLYVHRLIKLIYEEKRVSEQAKMGQLHLQITPHFLYNSFYQIYRLGKLGDTESVSEMSLRLSQFYQYITRSKDEAVMLLLELKHAEDYAAIQHIRFGGKIECHFDTIPEPCKELKVPKLFLQPLIENAYIHGLESTKDLSQIKIGFAYDNDELTISVENDGMLEDKDLKMLRERLKTPDPSGEITSLLNIHRRLLFMYGDSARMEVSRSDLGGLRVEISIRRQ